MLAEKYPYKKREDRPHSLVGKKESNGVSGKSKGTRSMVEKSQVSLKDEKRGQIEKQAKVVISSEVRGNQDHLDVETAGFNLEDFDDNTLAIFKKLFNILEQSITGKITADSLYEELRHVDSEITLTEVQDLIGRVDKDGNGEIGFDDLWLYMTDMGSDWFGGGENCDLEGKGQKKKFAKRKHLVYSAISHFSFKKTLAELKKALRKHAPHVIRHYAAGARLCGLTTHQLQRQTKKMQKSATHRKSDSPYAKPFQFVHHRAGKQKKVQRKKKVLRRKKVKMKKIKIDPSFDHKQESSPVGPAVANLNKQTKNTRHVFARKKKLAAGDDVRELRQKISLETAEMNKTLQDNTLSTMPSLHNTKSPLLFQPARKAPLTKTELPVSSNKAMRSRREYRKFKKEQKQRLTRIRYPLPSLKMKLTETPTIHDVNRIHAKAKQTVDACNHCLCQAEIHNAWEHWNHVYANVIRPKKLLENFKSVYSAYSSHREEEAFVVCPWNWGPSLFLKHTQKSPRFRSSKSSGNHSFKGSRNRTNYQVVKTRNLHYSPMCGKHSTVDRQTPSPQLEAGGNHASSTNTLIL